ncbi:MAG: MarR family winged helix-turn-helix transcriptional regulator [Solirubrobacteraceae bacterium]
MDLTLSRKLHKLTVRLDRAADVRLRTDAGVSYPRFLALYMVGSAGADTQRALAERLGVSEPSVSRMVRVLAENKWLEVVPDPDGKLNCRRRRRMGGRVPTDCAASRWLRRPDRPGSGDGGRD